ncbi:MAG: hypothetical protein ACRCZB_02815 [Bacteroidales bacterium]
MKSIFLSIQEKLGEITELKYIDKDWGQLQYEQPPVKFPCALLDVANADFSQLGLLAQTANANIEITIAHLHLVPSSASAARKQEAYLVLDIIDKIHELLHGWSVEQKTTPLIRTNISKADASKNYEIYRITYATTWRVLKEQKGEPVQVLPHINKEWRN